MTSDNTTDDDREGPFSQARPWQTYKNLAPRPMAPVGKLLAWTALAAFVSGVTCIVLNLLNANGLDTVGGGFYTLGYYGIILSLASALSLEVVNLHQHLSGRDR